MLYQVNFIIYISESNWSLKLISCQAIRLSKTIKQLYFSNYIEDS